MPITLSDTEMDSILKEVEQELGVVLKNEGAKLAKAADGDDDGDSDDKSGGSDSAPPASDGGSSSGGDSVPSAPPASASDASASAPPGAADGSAPPSDGSASADPAAQGSAGPMDVQGLTQEYAQLPDDVLEMHYVAAKAALMERLQGQSASGSAPAGSPPASPSPSAPPASPPASPSPSASASAPPMPPPDQSAPPTQKAEMVPAGKKVAAPAANGGKEAPIKKSEEVLALEAKVDEQTKMIEGLAKATEILLTTPQRRAVTSVAFMAKTESDKAGNDTTEVVDVNKLSKSEITAKLSEKSKDPKLAKSDRTLINQFCVGTVNVDKIAHLLK